MDPLKERIAKHLRDYQDVEPSVAQNKETREGTERQLHAVQQKVRAMQAESGEGRQALAVFGSKCTALNAVSLAPTTCRVSVFFISRCLIALSKFS